MEFQLEKKAYWCYYDSRIKSLIFGRYINEFILSKNRFNAQKNGEKRKKTKMKKMKRLVAVLMICVMMFSVAACGKQGTAKKEDKKIDGKVCVLTPTLSWSEDQYRSGEKMAEKYPGVVEHLTLPDDFAAEQETGITQIMNVAKDPSFKALVICYGDSGILPAIKMAKKENPDLKVITAPVWDDPYEMADVIDLCIDANWNKRGQVIAEKAKKMGAERIIHYSFPTHLKMEEIAQRRETMKKTAKKLGMDFIDVTMPDPYVTSDSATNQFIKEDIPKEIKYSFIAITKEALNNVMRHSNANEVKILAREHPGLYQLIIEDNGTSDKRIQSDGDGEEYIEQESAGKTGNVRKTENTESSGIGIENMKKRVRMLGGTIQIQKENGFRIFITVPKNEGKR